MSNSGRRRLLGLMGAGALASRMGWTADPGLATARTPRALVNTISVRLQRSKAGTILFAVDYAGSLDAKNHLHAIGGQLEFTHQPTEQELARAVRKALIQSATRVPGVYLRAQDITVVGPTFL